MKRIWFGLAAGLGTLIFSSCSALPDMSKDNIPSPASSRRIYVNDSAANDSLPGALVNLNVGVKFVLQPGRNYNLRFTTTFAGDRLSLFDYGSIYGTGSAQALGITTATTIDGGETFSLPSTQTQPRLFVGMLASGTAAAQRISRVRLVSLDTAQSNSLKVHLFMVGRFKNLPDATARSALAESLGSELKRIFAKYDIALDFSFENVMAESAPVTVAFSSSFTALPGTRRADAAHIYLIDSISSKDSTGTILGFAPREVVDLDQDPTSRVVISLAKVTDGVTLAFTAAHELGHFFGMRHPMSTKNDMDGENDQSNSSDGLLSTATCSVFRLAKKQASGGTKRIAVQDGIPYCLYVVGTAASDCSPTCTARVTNNLMWAYSCKPEVQDSLTSEQQTLQRRNMALMQGN